MFGVYTFVPAFFQFQTSINNLHTAASSVQRVHVPHYFSPLPVSCTMKTKHASETGMQYWLRIQSCRLMGGCGFGPRNNEELCGLMGVGAFDIWFRPLGCDRNSTSGPVDWNTNTTLWWRLSLIAEVERNGTHGELTMTKKEGLKPGFHYPSWRPELTARVNVWPVSITRQHGPSTRVVETGLKSLAIEAHGSSVLILGICTQGGPKLMGEGVEVGWVKVQTLIEPDWSCRSFIVRTLNARISCKFVAYVFKCTFKTQCVIRLYVAASRTFPIQATTHRICIKWIPWLGAVGQDSGLVETGTRTSGSASIG